jgi:hypothetical protein
MLPQCSHITRKRGIYYYRRRLPKPLCGEIAVSLRTKIFLEADWLSQCLDRAFERALQLMTESGNQLADIAGIAKRYLRDALENDLLVRQAQAGHVPKSAWFAWAASIDAVDLELDAAKAVLAGRKLHGRAELIDWLMDKHNVPEEQRRELTFAILQADVAKWEAIRKRTLGQLDGFQDAQSIAVTAPTVAANGSNTRDWLHGIEQGSDSVVCHRCKKLVIASCDTIMRVPLEFAKRISVNLRLHR